MRSDGGPEFRVGNFGVVFKVLISGKPKAIKLFTRYVPHRVENYGKVCDFMSMLTPSQRRHLGDYSLLNDELFVFGLQDNLQGHYYPLILMDWVEGESAATHIREAVLDRDMARLHTLGEQFIELSIWLLDQSFAHGDLKPENIIIRQSDGVMLLIDYDAMYVPRMSGQIAVEVGTPPFQHPARCKFPLGKHIDDYSIAIIALSIRALEIDPRLWAEFHNGENLILNGAQIIDNQDECYKRLATMPEITQNSIYQLLNSPTIVLEGLRNALVQLNNLPLLSPEPEAPLESSMNSRKDSTQNLYLSNQSPHSTIPKKLMPHKTKGLWGYIGERGDWDITPRFLSAMEFNQGLAAVRDTCGWGFIDIHGCYKIPPQFACVTSFSEGLSAVAMLNKFGYIDTQGEMVIPPRYDKTTHIRQGLGLVKKGNKYGFISAKKRKMAISAKFDYAQSFCESVAVAMVNKKYGYIDLKGNWIIKPQFDYAQSCHNGKALVEINNQNIEIQITPILKVE